MSSSSSPSTSRNQPRHSAPRRSNAYTQSSTPSYLPSTPSGLSKSVSTPYNLHSNSHSRRSSILASTPLRSSLATPHHDASFSSSLSNPASPVFRRNAGFGSPGIRASATAGSRSSYDASRSSSPAPAQGSGLRSSPAPASPNPSSARKARLSRGFVRKKHWAEKLKTVPVDLFYQAQSRLLEFEDVLHDPAFGYPIGLALHVLSLLSHLISPTSPIGVVGRSSASGRSRGAFGGAGGLGSARAQQLRRLARSQMEAWLRWTSIGLSLALLAIASYNAYILFTSRRPYRFWLRNEKDEIRSENARLVPVDLNDAEQDASKPTLKERLASAALQVLRDVPILGWFLPAALSDVDQPSLAQRSAAETTRMYELSMWQAPEVPLRMFGVYSPLHALIYLLRPSSVGTLLLHLLVMAGMTMQTLLLSRWYAALVKDKTILAGEVMREYDERFVLPRAMPLVREVGTQTMSYSTMVPGPGWLVVGDESGEVGGGYY